MSCSTEASAILPVLAISLLAVAPAPAPAASPPPPPQRPIEVRFATIAPEGTPWSEQMTAMKARIEKESGGRIVFKLYFGGQLGGETETLRSLQRGRVQAWGGSTGALAALVPELQLTELPYLFHTLEEADHVFDEVLFRPYADLLAKKGLVLQSWNENGWRSIGSKDRAHPVSLRCQGAQGEVAALADPPAHVEGPGGQSRGHLRARGAHLAANRRGGRLRQFAPVRHRHVLAYRREALCPHPAHVPGRRRGVQQGLPRQASGRPPQHPAGRRQGRGHAGTAGRAGPGAGGAEADGNRRRQGASPHGCPAPGLRQGAGAVARRVRQDRRRRSPGQDPQGPGRLPGRENGPSRDIPKTLPKPPFPKTPVPK